MGPAQALQPTNKIGMVDRTGGVIHQFSKVRLGANPGSSCARAHRENRQDGSQTRSLRCPQSHAPRAPPGLGQAHNGNSYPPTVQPAACAGFSITSDAKGTARGLGTIPPGDGDESSDDSSDCEARRREERTIRRAERAAKTEAEQLRGKVREIKRVDMDFHSTIPRLASGVDARGRRFLQWTQEGLRVDMRGRRSGV